MAGTNNARKVRALSGEKAPLRSHQGMLLGSRDIFPYTLGRAAGLAMPVEFWRRRGHAAVSGTEWCRKALNSGAAGGIDALARRPAGGFPRPSAFQGTREIALGRSHAPRASDLNRGRHSGEEDRRLHQAADPGRQGESVAAGRPGARSARPEHHAVREGIQRGDAADGARHPDAGRHHRVHRPHLLLHHQDAAEHLFPAQGRQAREGQHDAGQKCVDRPRDEVPAAPRSPRPR